MDWTDVEMELGATGRDDLAEWCSDEVARLTKERDAAFSMSRCECSSDEACRNISALRESLETIARVSNDPAIVACAKHALMPNPALGVCAKARFYEFGGGEEPDPLERLRFFCSLAMHGQDWIDVEPFFDDVQTLLAPNVQDHRPCAMGRLRRASGVFWMAAERLKT